MTRSYIIISDTQYFVEHLLLDIGKKSPQSTIIVMLSKLQAQSIQDLLERAWKIYYMLDVIILQYHNINEKEQIKHQVSFYQPFLVIDGKRGSVTDIVLNDASSDIFGIKKRLEERFHNLHGYHLKTCDFQLKIASLENNVTVGPNVDQTFAALQKSMNFKEVYLPISMCAYESYLPNSSFKGSWEQMELGNIDFIMENRRLQAINWSNVVLLKPIIEVRFTFVMAKIYENYGELLLRSLGINNLLMFIFTYILIIITWKILDTANKKLFAFVRGESCIELIIKVIGTSLLVSQTYNARCNQSPIVMTLLYFSLITTSIFQANIVSSITTPKNIYDINTWEELDATDLSLTTISPLMNFLKSILNAKIESGHLSPNITSRLMENNGDAIRDVCNHKTSAFFIDDVHARQYQLINCGDKSNKKRIHLMPYEIFPKNYVTKSAAKNLPFLKRFDWILSSIFESGLINKWRDDMFKKNSLPFIKNMSLDESDALFNMQQLQFIFMVWFYLCIFSITVLFLEILLHDFLSKYY